MDKFITWEEVKKVHKVVSGVSIKDKKISSLLCNVSKGQRYPNEISQDEIKYFVDSSTRPDNIMIMIDSIGSNTIFPVFLKLAVNKWQNYGYFKIEALEEENDEYLAFKLIRTK